MINNKTILVIVISVAFFCHCNRNLVQREEEDRLQAIILETDSLFAPDKRTNIFELKVKNEPVTGWVLTGETTQKESIKYLQNRLSENHINHVIRISTLPDSSICEFPVALVNVSVANLRGIPSHRAELVTQEVLGTPLRILKKKQWWYLVQTPDRYIAWVDSGGICTLTSSEYETYLEKPKIIFTANYGTSFNPVDEIHQIVSDLVAGSVLELIGSKNGWNHVRYPDGRTALIDKNLTRSYDTWIQETKADETTLVATAMRFIGIPYLWGGTSTKGMDCSGLTKTIYFMNGVLLPRDASQQAIDGILVDSTGNFENLNPGDLLFFGHPLTDSTAERVVHVAMWIGNGRFVHASGDVNIRSMSKNDSLYDAYNHNRYLRTKRLINQDEFPLIYLRDYDVYAEILQ